MPQNLAIMNPIVCPECANQEAWRLQQVLRVAQLTAQEKEKGRKHVSGIYLMPQSFISKLSKNSIGAFYPILPYVGEIMSISLIVQGT